MLQAAQIASDLQYLRKRVGRCLNIESTRKLRTRSRSDLLSEI